jgi:rubrerythrin
VFEIREIVDLAIRLENNGEKTYRKACGVVFDPKIRELLMWMADEEARHARWFADILQGLESGRRQPFLEEMGRELFQDVVGSQSFSLKEVDFSAVADTRELFEVFIEFEQDTVLFYEMLAPFIEERACRDQLQAIVAEENRHIAQLQEAIGRSLAPVVAGGR